MTEINHRRGTRRKAYPTYSKPFMDNCLDNGFVDSKHPWKYINHGGHAITVTSEMTKKSYSGLINYETSNGHRGFAKARRGIKQGIHRALRQHERLETEKLSKYIEDE